MVDIDQYYQVLDLEPGASWDQIKQSYRDLAYVWHPDRYPDSRPLLKQKAQDKLKAINVAYDCLCSHLHTSSRVASAPSDQTPTGEQTSASPSPAQDSPWDLSYLHRARLGDEVAIHTLIAIELAYQGIKAEVSFSLGLLQVKVDAIQHQEPEVLSRTLSAILSRVRICHIHKALVMGTTCSGERVWSRSLLAPTLPRRKSSFWLAFDQLELNTLAFPLALVLAAVITQVTLLSWGALPFHTWVQGLGHVLLSWLSSRVFGASSGDPRLSLPARSLWVYGLTAIGLWRWGQLAWRWRWPWQLGLAGALILLQFWLTFVISDAHYVLLLAWAGVGGEMILGALMMSGFYMRCRFWWRWSLWRYPVLVVGACLYWHGFERWHGLGAYWQSDWQLLLAGPTRTALEVEQVLLGSHWSPYQIIQTLAYLSELCGILLIGVYVVSLCRSRGLQSTSAGSAWGWQRFLQQLRIRVR